MSHIVWQEHLFSVGVHELDEQHQKLFDIINDLHDAIQAGRGKDALPNTMVAIVSYVNEHFSTEESLMQKIGYRGLEQQKTMHQTFKNKIICVLQELKSGKSVSPIQVHSMIKEWLTVHVQDEDKKLGTEIARLLKEKQASKKSVLNNA